VTEVILVKGGRQTDTEERIIKEAHQEILEVNMTLLCQDFFIFQMPCSHIKCGPTDNNLLKKKMLALAG